MVKKILAGLLTLAIFLPQVAMASDFDKDKDDVIYGVALNDDQINLVDKAMDVADDVNVSRVDGSDLEKYLGYSTADSNMISSVYVKRHGKSKGISVKIKTPENITEITEGQYTNAAITAGITGADILVASPKPVTGESALVGVYKSEQLRGVKLDSKRTQTAQEELETVSSVAKENEGKDKFDSKKLDKVVIDVKQKLAENKKKTGENASSDQIAVYIKDALNNVNMGDILSNNNIQILVNYFENYQNTSAIDSAEVKENLTKLAGDITQKAGKFYEDNKDSINKVAQEAKDSGLWDKIMEFFRSIFDSIMKAFNNNDEASDTNN